MQNIKQIKKIYNMSTFFSINRRARASAYEQKRISRRAKCVFAETRWSERVCFNFNLRSNELVIHSFMQDGIYPFRFSGLF